MEGGGVSMGKSDDVIDDGRQTTDVWPETVMHHEDTTGTMGTKDGHDGVCQPGLRDGVRRLRTSPGAQRQGLVPVREGGAKVGSIDQLALDLGDRPVQALLVRAGEDDEGQT